MWLVLPKRDGVKEVVTDDCISAVLAACSLF